MNPEDLAPIWEGASLNPIWYTGIFVGDYPTLAEQREILLASDEHGSGNIRNRYVIQFLNVMHFFKTCYSNVIQFLTESF
jgi:hypothetical protein